MKIAFPTDEHRPFQDEKALAVAHEIVRDFDPDLRITGSDSLDFYALSKFDKDPARLRVGLQDEIDSFQAGEREWKDAAPNARVRWIDSNHIDRLRKFLWQHPEIAGLRAMQLPNVLELDALGVEYEPMGDHANKEIEIEGKILIKHGAYVRKFSGMSAKAELEAEFHDITVLSGHTHRGGTYLASTRHGVVQAQECFCLCRLDPPYLAHPNWQQGIVLAEIVNGVVSLEPVVIHTVGAEKVAIWRGKEYHGK
jgi:hypothetical protein